MLRSTRLRRLAPAFLLAGGCLTAAIAAACGSSSDQPGATDVFPDSSTNDVTIPTGDGDPNFVPVKGDSGGAGGGSSDGGTQTLTIAPATATITVTDRSALPAQPFTASIVRAGAPTPVQAIWSLADFTVANISQAGVATPKGTVAGDVTVVASYGGATAKAILHVIVKLAENLTDTTLPDGTKLTESAASSSPANLTALGKGAADAGADAGGDSGADGGAPGKLLYPYDQTVFPKGLLAPVPQFAPGVATPEDFKVTLDTTGFHWDGFGHVGNPQVLLAAIPQDIWSGALASAQPDAVTKKASVTLSVTKAAAGVAYGTDQSQLIIAPGKLTGVIYYESYSGAPSGTTETANTLFGLWAVKPGETKPPVNLQPGCIICHGASASGNVLTAGTDDPANALGGGVFRPEADGGFTHLATSPTVFPPVIGTSGVADGGTMDPRGLSWATVSPDGKMILRAAEDFWGGKPLLAWAVPSDPLTDGKGNLLPLSTSMTVTGSPTIFSPAFSVDGRHLTYVNAQSAFGPPSQSVGVLDVAMNVADGGTGGDVSFSHQTTIYDSTQPGANPANAWTKVPTFLPDSKSVVLEETVNGYAGFNSMLPDFGGVDGRLYVLSPNGAGGYAHVELTHADTTNIPIYNYYNYEPKPLPVEVGGYYWVVFTSYRLDGYPQVKTPKKLWVTALSVGAAAGTDPSNPPFALTNQSIASDQQSQRGYWALAPCHADGTSCETGDDCCNGSCRPQADTDPSSPLVCRKPAGITCSADGDRCRAGHDEDCCNAPAGSTCIGTLGGFGKCATPAPPAAPPH